MLIHNFEQWHIVRELNLNKCTVSQWSYFVRQVLTEWMIHSSKITGGPGKLWKLTNESLADESIIKATKSKDNECLEG